jgi:pimeloyl-ACP methyl ester carboxylesterase
MRNLTAILLLGVGAVLAQPAPALAKINIGQSIEWVVVDSDRIVTGKLKKIDPYAPDPRREIVTVTVDKTLKGAAAETATFLVSPHWGPIARDWQAEGKPMMFFLVKNAFKDKDSPLAKFEWVLREERLAYSALFLGEVKHDWVKTRTMRVFTREFDVLSKPEDIIKRVEKIVAAVGKTPRRESYQVEVPWKSAAHYELYSGSAVYLILPVGQQYGAKRHDIQLDKHKGFILHPEKPAADGSRPWVWYAPTIGAYPNQSNEWVLRKLLDRGFYVAGIDVGESYGSPAGRKVYAEFHEHVVDEFKLDPQARLLAQSRGGLMLYSWAAEYPDKVRCIVGIYPVCDLRSYPGLKKAAPAYGMTPAELEKQLKQHNPIDRLEALAKAKVPILHIHGDTDTVVPLEKNSQVVLDRYTALGGKMKLIVVAGKGHAEIPEYFQEPGLVQFLSDGGFPTEKKSP